jgi:hypothetical protein
MSTEYKKKVIARALMMDISKLEAEDSSLGRKVGNGIQTDATR